MAITKLVNHASYQADAGSYNDVVATTAPRELVVAVCLHLDVEMQILDESEGPVFLFWEAEQRNKVLTMLLGHWLNLPAPSNSSVTLALEAKGFLVIGRTHQFLAEKGPATTYVRKLTNAESNAYLRKKLFAPEEPEENIPLYIWVQDNGKWDASWNDNATDDEGDDAESLLKYLNGLPF